jgi:hypothetical protein
MHRLAAYLPGVGIWTQGPPPGKHESYILSAVWKRSLLPLRALSEPGAAPGVQARCTKSRRELCQVPHPDMSELALEVRPLPNSR